MASASKRTSKTASALDWHYYADPTSGETFSQDTNYTTSRRIRVGQPGDLYLLPVGSSAEKLFAENMQAGEQVDVQCDGIGSSTTCTEVTVHF